MLFSRRDFFILILIALATVVPYMTERPLGWMGLTYRRFIIFALLYFSVKMAYSRIRK